ncbi:MAG: hypothetical protein HC855_12405 [Rhizobiales bacterium]|nr:hypothetical protein [Hyphomicrobiales bacterium]
MRFTKRSLLPEGAFFPTKEVPMSKLRVLCAAAVLACSANFASAGEDTRVYVAHLLGGHELPVAGDPNAFGVATLVITLPAQVCYSIVLRSPVAATAAHVHAGGGGRRAALFLPCR